MNALLTPSFLAATLILHMPSRRLDDRIRELCASIVKAREEELEPAISGLKSALREHTTRLRKIIASRSLSGAKPEHKERRSRPATVN